jgi:hypothetical protein
MDAFSKKIGPLPAYGWLLGIAAAYLAWHLYSKSKGNVGSPGSSLNAPALQFDATGATSNNGAVSSGGGMQLGLGTIGPTVVTPPITTHGPIYSIPTGEMPGSTMPTNTPKSQAIQTQRPQQAT